MDKHLHIVSLDVPLPADYGGVIDIFYKIKSLHAIGVKIHLHCFTKGRVKQPELNNYCESVHYYKREKKQAFLNPLLPYIVSSRNSPDLIKNLNIDTYPILLEGIHCSFLLQSGQLKNRKVFLRLHNTEHIYYNHLAKLEKDFLKRIYFQIESKRLKKYEKEIANKATLLAISEADKKFFENEMGASKVELLPGFTPFDEVKCLAGLGDYALYHGNLSVNENEVSVLEIVEENLFSKEMPLIIAGKNPSANLIKTISEKQNCSLVSNPSDDEMQELIQNAQVNILPSANATGVKLKLLNALFNGRHCLVNKAAVEGTNLESLCHIAATAKDYKPLLKNLSTQVFKQAEIAERKAILLKEYNNEKNAQLLSSWL